MKQRLLLATLLALVAFTVECAAQTPAAETPAPKAFDQTHALWTEVLAAHVKGDGIAFAQLKKDPSKLDAYLRSLESVKRDAFAQWNAKEQFAFWIDAYNAYTLKRVADAYPIASIKDLGDEKLSVWDREFVPLGALAPDLKKEKLTLNDIENKILRPGFKDARVHAAIHCASQGCPLLRNEAFVAAKLDAQLDEQVKLWLSDRTRNRFDKDKGLLELSLIFEWYRVDFEHEAGSAQAWIARFLPDQASWLNTKKKYVVKYLDYSWKLDDAR